MPNEVTSAQFRMARAALMWTVRELSSRSGVHRNTIMRIEAGLASDGSTIAAVRRTFEAAGVEFTNSAQPGVRLSGPGGTIPAEQLNASNDE
jgi:transcriptional regulator with XRE-family HTH domain